MPYYIIEIEEFKAGNWYYEKRFKDKEKAKDVAGSLMGPGKRITIWYLGDIIWMDGRECH